MDTNDFYACISTLSDQALANLRVKKCVPLPKYYQSKFNTAEKIRSTISLNKAEKTKCMF